MAAPEPKDQSDASYPYLLPLESSDDEEIHVAEVVNKKQKLQSESGMKSISFPPFHWENFLFEVIPIWPLRKYESCVRSVKYLALD